MNNSKINTTKVYFVFGNKPTPKKPNFSVNMCKW